jgi:hypothetical protein
VKRAEGGALASRAPGQHQREHVGQIVPRIGQQRGRIAATPAAASATTKAELSVIEMAKAVPWVGPW